MPATAADIAVPLPFSNPVILVCIVIAPLEFDPLNPLLLETDMPPSILLALAEVNVKTPPVYDKVLVDPLAAFDVILKLLDCIGVNPNAVVTSVLVSVIAPWRVLNDTTLVLPGILIQDDPL